MLSHRVARCGSGILYRMCLLFIRMPREQAKMQDSTQRFSTRVANYIKYRPLYPPAVLETLRQSCGLTDKSVIADVGSGTGILAEIFLRNGNTVYGIEPNREMREAGERLLLHYPNFSSIDGTAEVTMLQDGSVSFVTAGQAFHWFDKEQARVEFARILEPGGWVCLVWNSRLLDATPFLRDYEALLHTYGTDYEQTKHQNLEAATFNGFFTGPGPQVAAFPNRQMFDYRGLEGRLLSSSYTPEPGHPNHEPMLQALRALFDRHQIGGEVAFEYKTELYYGHVEQLGK